MSPERQLERVGSRWAELNRYPAVPNWSIVSAGYDYYDAEERPVPFPCHPYYDAKAWRWLESHLDEIPGEVLFWNIGSLPTA